MFTVDYYDTAGGRRKKEIIGKLEISNKKKRKLDVFLSFYGLKEHFSADSCGQSSAVCFLFFIRSTIIACRRLYIS